LELGCQPPNQLHIDVQGLLVAVGVGDLDNHPAKPDAVAAPGH
jgi:hypothetical protein